MVGHKHLDNNSPHDSIFIFYDSLVTHKILIPNPERDSIFSIIDERWDKLVGKYEDPSMVEYSDLETVKTSFLIENIDFAFEAWRTYPWAKHLTWQQFCEYLLPYKISNEPLLPWREKLMKKYAWLPDSLPNKSDAMNATRVLYNNLKWFYLNRRIWRHSLVGQENLHLARSGTCFNKTDLNMFVMRAMGLAVTRDFILYWGNRDSNHYWNSFITNDGAFLDFEGLGELNQRWQGRMPKHKIVNLGPFYKSTARFSKVFRETFLESKNTLVDNNKIGIYEDIPPEFRKTRYYDVTSEYVDVTSVDIKLTNLESLPKYAYLCTYNKNEWRPAYWGRVNKDGNTHFLDMGRQILYIPCKYDKNRFIPLSNPFVLDSLGKVVELNNPNEIRQTVNFTHDISATRTIKKGATYELYEWNKTQWILAGKSTAEGKSKITFENVPQNTLLRLQKVNGNKNERIFYYANGVQYFY
jgi:hypothetical protein